MLNALTDLNAYKAQQNLTVGELRYIGNLDGSDGDGPVINGFPVEITNADVQSPLKMLTTGSGAAEYVPEPTTIVLAGIGAAVLLAIRRIQDARGPLLKSGGVLFTAV